MNVKHYVSQYKSDDNLFVKKLESSKSWKKAVKDPDMPKRPASAFFIFMEGFRQTYKENYPDNKSVTAVGRAGGEKWKSFSDEEKAPYVAEAGKRKADYEKDMKAYSKKRFEVHDDENDNEEDNSEEDGDFDLDKGVSSLADEPLFDKAPYEAEAGKRKADYNTDMPTYNKRQFEVHDDEDDNEEDNSEEGDDFDLDKDVSSLADEPLFEKAPYEAEAGKRKADYNTDMPTYNKRQCEGIKQEDYEKSESEVHDDEDDNEENNSGEDDDYITSNLPQASFSSSHCKDTHIRKERSGKSASLQQSADLTTNIRNAGIVAMWNMLLQSLKTDDLDKVKASAVSAYSVYEFIRSIGGDPSELQTLINAYVRSVKVLFAVKRDIKCHVSESSVEVSKIEMSFQSAQATYEEELRINKDLEKQLSEVTQKKVALETSLRGLREEEMTLKERCRQQVDRTLMFESSVSSLQQKMKFVEKLKKAQSNVDKCMEGLESAML